jgi:hypothetical protein
MTGSAQMTLPGSYGRGKKKTEKFVVTPNSAQSLAS